MNWERNIAVRTISGRNRIGAKHLGAKHPSGRNIPLPTHRYFNTSLASLRKMSKQTLPPGRLALLTLLTTTVFVQVASV